MKLLKIEDIDFPQLYGNLEKYWDKVGAKREIGLPPFTGVMVLEKAPQG